jgi:putative FmdB family regulatory protein
MPTYDYKCKHCGHEEGVFQTISAYSHSPIQLMCCDSIMERKLSVVPAMSGLANALAGDRHYDGLRAPDGTDISTRTKHREYMKSRGLTTADDFKGVWQSAAKEREERLSGVVDNALRSEVSDQVMRAVAQPD